MKGGNEALSGESESRALGSVCRWFAEQQGGREGEGDSGGDCGGR